jgi:NTE family protein
MDFKNKDKKNKIDTIVFSGGGVKGFVFIGAVKFLEEINIMKNITTYIGTSIGAYFAILYIIGYTSDELYQFVKKFDFMNTNNFKFNKIFENLSLDDCNNFTVIFNNLLKNKNIKEDITLLELYKKTNLKLILTTVCLTDKKLEYVSHENYPNLPLITALRMSTSIPLFYPPVKFSNKLYIDGGILNNFPIDIVNYKLDEVIGINIIFDFDCKDNYNNIFDYIKDIFNLYINKNQKYINNNNIYNIPVKNANPLDMNLSKEKKKELMKSGYDYMKNNFK